MNVGVSGTLASEFNRISDFESRSEVRPHQKQITQSRARLSRVFEAKKAQLRAMSWMAKARFLKALISPEYLEDLAGEISGYEFMVSRGVVIIPLTSKHSVPN